MENSTNSIINITRLSKAYNGLKVLDGINLQVPKNSIYGFLGPNGAGKSTTIKLILGLMHPTSGRIIVFGDDVQVKTGSIRRRIGYLAQEPRYYDYTDLLILDEPAAALDPGGRRDGADGDGETAQAHDHLLLDPHP